MDKNERNFTYSNIFFNREAESRQALELANRKLQADMKGKEQMIMKNELDVNELKSNLDSAKEAKNFQVKLIVRFSHQYLRFFSVRETEHEILHKLISFLSKGEVILF